VFTVAISAALLLAPCGDGPASEAVPTPTTTVPATTSNSPTTTSSTSQPAAPPDGAILISAFGVVQQRDDGSLEICPAPSDGCAGIAIDGDIAPPDTDLPAMELTGWYDGVTLTVTTSEVPDLSGLMDRDFTTPCEELRGSGSVGNPPTDSEDAVWAYLETISDRYAGRWWDTANGVMTIWMTGEDVAGHRAALEAAASENERVCVIGGADYAEAALIDVQRQLFDVIDMEATAPLSSSLDTLGNRVEVTVEYLDAPTRAQVEDEFGDAVVFIPFIEVPGGTIADLPDQVAARPGDVALLTKSTRAGGGMEALGTFEVRFDAEPRCVYFADGGDDTDGDGRTVPIWPFGYTATSDPLQVFDQDGRLVAREGDVIQMGGGHVGPPGDDRPENCGTTDVWIMRAVPAAAANAKGATAPSTPSSGVHVDSAGMFPLDVRLYRIGEVPRNVWPGYDRFKRADRPAGPVPRICGPQDLPSIGARVGLVREEHW